MKEPQTIVLERPWGGHAAGAELRVLGPSDEIRPGAVDALRASTLLAGGFAVLPSDGETAEAEESQGDGAVAPPKPRARGKKARG